MLLHPLSPRVSGPDPNPSKDIEAALGLAHLQGLQLRVCWLPFPDILLPEAVTCLAYAGMTPI